MKTQDTSKAVKEFSKLTAKISRLRTSKLVAKHVNYEFEQSNGWGGEQRHQHNERAEQAFDRMETLEEEALELYSLASSVEKKQIEAIDTMHIADGA